MKDKNKQLSLVSRPPIIVVLGHIDHGKTTLLDYIRNTKITEKESGGITQHIGAYEIEVNNHKITFIDTPGHEAFSKIRSRGAKAADIAILVVAADEGVKQQTKESLKTIQEAQISFIVAITKIDKPEANIEKVKNELSEAGVLLEGRGGEVPVVGVSSKTGQGIDELLELLILISEIKDLKANTNKPASGIIIESHSDRLRGNIATLIITDGTLYLKDKIRANHIKGKVKILENFQGKPISKATFSSPVRVIGFEKTVPVGSQFYVVANNRQITKSNESLQTTIKELGSKNSKIKIPIIIKTDATGSGEALEKIIKEIGEKNNWLFIILKNGIGDISESDLKIASAEKTIIIGFHVKKRPEINNILSTNKNLLLIEEDIIYEIKDKIEQLVKTKFIEKPSEEIIGKLEVLLVFNPVKNNQLIGGKVTEGIIQNKIHFHLIREEKIINDGNVLNIQKNKIDVTEVKTGNECGLLVNCPEKIQKGDILVFFRKI